MYEKTIVEEDMEGFCSLPEACDGLAALWWFSLFLKCPWCPTSLVPNPEVYRQWGKDSSESEWGILATLTSMAAGEGSQGLQESKVKQGGKQGQMQPDLIANRGDRGWSEKISIVWMFDSTCTCPFLPLLCCWFNFTEQRLTFPLWQ